MKKILFVCHGNICRSPMAEFVMKDLVKKAGLASQFHIESAATSREEIGNPVYPGAAQAGGAWDLLRRPCGTAAHQCRLREVRPADRHGQREPAEYVPHLRRRLCRQVASLDGLHRPSPRCCRPVVHRRLRIDLARCAGGVSGLAERIIAGAR